MRVICCRKHENSARKRLKCGRKGEIGAASKCGSDGNLKEQNQQIPDGGWNAQCNGCNKITKHYVMQWVSKVWDTGVHAHQHTHNPAHVQCRRRGGKRPPCIAFHPLCHLFYVHSVSNTPQNHCTHSQSAKIAPETVQNSPGTRAREFRACARCRPHFTLTAVIFFRF